MDPLSVTASVVGLLLAAGKVASAISTMKSIWSDTPQMVDHLLSQVTQIETCLSATQKFLDSVNSASRRRLGLIKVQDLVGTLTQTVLTFSELEALVNKIIKAKNSVTLRMKWTRKQSRIASIMLRLESHKSSLSLMLSIAQCESDLEASRSSEALHKLAIQILASNKDVSNRLRNLEDIYDSGSVYTACHRNGSSDSESVFSVEKSIMETSMDQNIYPLRTLPEPTAHQSFQFDLNTSRVYRRTLSYECDISFTTSMVRTHAWSIFTGLSLSEVSEISVIALPLSAQDISNPQWYFKSSEKYCHPPSKPVKKIPPSPLRTATERRKAIQRTQSWPQAEWSFRENRTLTASVAAALSSRTTGSSAGSELLNSSAQNHHSPENLF